MKKLNLFFLLIIATSSFAQETLHFEDGTKIDVLSADLSVHSIRKLNVGFVAGLDGIADLRFFNVNYLQPEKFYAGINLGIASFSAEGIIFLKGKDVVKKKGIQLKYVPKSSNETNVYVARVDLQKRKEIGIYIAVSDFGSVFNMLKGDIAFEEDANTNGFSKLTAVYAGIAFTNYWGVNIHTSERYGVRGHYLGRTVLAPFFIVNSKPASYADTENVPAYGTRLAYELTNSITFFNLNFGVKAGVDAFFRKGKSPTSGFSNFAVAPIIALGLGFSF